MKITSLLFTSFLLITSILNAQNFEWANSMGSSEFELGKAIAVDDLGNSYSTGVFRGTVDFDPSAAVLNLTAIDLSDGYVQKLDSDGNLIWAKAFGGLNYVSGNAMAIDASGNVYVAGHFFETADFDPGVGVYNLTSAADEDVFVLKLDPNGDFLWAKSFGAEDDDVARSIAIDLAGNVCVTGLYVHTVDFDPGPGVAELTSITSGGPFPSENSDVFVLKLTPAGDYIWCKSIGGEDSDMAYGVTTDNSNNIYLTGHYRETSDFDPGIDVFNSTAIGQYDIFVLKLDVNGDFLWMKSIGSPDNDEGYGIVAEGPHSVYVTGYFSGTADFNPDAGVHNLTSNGAYDIFALKLNADGSFAWANSMGSTGSDIGTSVATNIYGDFFLTGQYYGTVDFDASASVYELTSNGDADIFVQKLSTSGDMDWTVSEGNSGNDIGKGITALGGGYVYLLGGFQNTVDFGVNAPAYDLTSVGSFDIFNQKLGAATYGVGLVDLMSQNAITIYPNPTNGHLTIDSEENILSVKVINLLGELVYELKQHASIEMIDLNDLSSGAYTLQLIGAENSWNKRICIQH
ncbi:MAG: hypothetical protein ACJA1C_002509 [Crocinitomicaceae bacterium]|jgi:hypothetical protein